MSTEEFDLDEFIRISMLEPEKTQEERDAEEVPFNSAGYYTHAADSRGIAVYSECCADTLDLDSAIVLRDRLNRWIERQS